MGFSVKLEEDILFFPTAANYNPRLGVWEIPIHGQIFEKEEKSWIRKIFIKSLRKTLDIPKNTQYSSHFQERLRWFLVDNQRWKTVSIKLGEKSYKLKPSRANGHFVRKLVLSAQEVEDLLQTKSSIGYQAILAENDPRIFQGEVSFPKETGISIVSDIDDTIKYSDVRNKKNLLKNSFLFRFSAIPGMAEFFQQLQQNKVQFHYVSASPWQLYPLLKDFLQEEGFPKGIFHLKKFRVKDSDFFNLFMPGLDYKYRSIEPILQKFPKRRFILIGDSGEKDPEAYSVIAKRHPQQINKILIRLAYPEAKSRFEKLFSHLPREKWQVFSAADEIDRTSLTE
ncbi:MAG: phosphatase domain-containing protein [Spirochaetota bacterium]